MSNDTTDARFELDVLKSDIPVLVDFWAPWCGPCRMVSPLIEAVGKKMAGKARVYKINVDENPETAGRYGITAVPTAVVFRDGRVETHIQGIRPEITYEQALLRSKHREVVH